MLKLDEFDKNSVIDISKFAGYILPAFIVFPLVDHVNDIFTAKGYDKGFYKPTEVMKVSVDDKILENMNLVKGGTVKVKGTETGVKKVPGIKSKLEQEFAVRTLLKELDIYKMEDEIKYANLSDKELKNITKFVMYLKHVEKNVNDEETKEIVKENLDNLTKALKVRIEEGKMKVQETAELNL